MWLPCSKLYNSNLIKDRNIIFAVSKRYINIIQYKLIGKHNHIKRILNFIRFINHFYRNNVAYVILGVHIVFKGPYL